MFTITTMTTILMTGVFGLDYSYYSNWLFDQWKENVENETVSIEIYVNKKILIAGIQPCYSKSFNPFARSPSETDHGRVSKILPGSSHGQPDRARS